jgi:hypothetical protein
MRRECERRQTEEEFEVVSAGKAPDGQGRERGNGELGKSIAGDCGVHGPTIDGPGGGDNERSLKRGLLLYDHA